MYQAHLTANDLRKKKRLNGMTEKRHRQSEFTVISPSGRLATSELTIKESILEN